MPRILLIRHASHDLLGRELVGRRSGVTLSSAGSAEAEALAERLARHPISVVYASPRERAIETAKPIAERHRLDVHIAPELDEVDFGTWTGLSFTDGFPTVSANNPFLGEKRTLRGTSSPEFAILDEQQTHRHQGEE